MMRRLICRGLVLGALATFSTGCDTLHPFQRKDSDADSAKKDDKDDSSKMKAVDADTSKILGVDSLNDVYTLATRAWVSHVCAEPGTTVALSVPRARQPSRSSRRCFRDPACACGFYALASRARPRETAFQKPRRLALGPPGR